MSGSDWNPAIDHDPSHRRVVVAKVDETTLASGVATLADMDPILAALAEQNGIPPLWPREPGFPTLVRLILEQQVSLASAEAAYRKLEVAIGSIAPEPFLRLDDAELKTIGFSRQKSAYVRGLAVGLIEGTVDLDEAGDESDAVAMGRLQSIRGVGPWTAACYLLFALRRSDVWPPGDRALQVSMGRVYGLTEVPDAETSSDRADAWRPLRSIAARLLWHEYLGGRP